MSNVGASTIISEKYCDGLGACIGKCPEDAITIEEREAEEFDENEVEKHLLESRGCKSQGNVYPLGVALNWEKTKEKDENFQENKRKSELSRWPVKLNLVNPCAPHFKNSDLLIAANCSAFSYGDFHMDFLRSKIIVIGYSKFNDIKYYIKKLT